MVRGDASSGSGWYIVVHKILVKNENASKRNTDWCLKPDIFATTNGPCLKGLHRVYIEESRIIRATCASLRDSTNM